MRSTKYQLILSRSTYIKEAPDHEKIPIDNINDLATISHCAEIVDTTNTRINLLCGVVHVFPSRFVQKVGKFLQEFVIIHEESKPLILTLWDEFLQDEAAYLTENVHKFPVILCMRLSVNTFHGLSVGTLFNNTILFEPPILQTKMLQACLKSQKEYVDTIVSRKLYEKEKQTVHEPLQTDVQKISQILSLPQKVKSFWIKADIGLSKPNEPLFILTCPNCSKPCGAAYGIEFTCVYCNNDFPCPKPIWYGSSKCSFGTARGRKIARLIDR